MISWLNIIRALTTTFRLIIQKTYIYIVYSYHSRIQIRQFLCRSIVFVVKVGPPQATNILLKLGTRRISYFITPLILETYAQLHVELYIQMHLKWQNIHDDK